MTHAGPVIALDANGADGGPSVVAEGARRAGLQTLLYGPSAELGEVASELIEVIDAPVGIANDEEPALAVRAKEDASVVQAAKAVGAGRAAALVSAGSTGALLAASLFHVKRIRGVHRPAVAVLLPVPGKPVLMLDVGANVEVRTEHLVQFAYMGSAFMQAVHGVERPRVALLSVGEEGGKGTPQVVEAHGLLEQSPLNFTGNIEGNDVTIGAADVVVTDGFTGNVALKLMEGTAKTVVGAIRGAVRSGRLSSLGGVLIRGKVAGLRRDLDPNTTGGAILLGVRRPAVVAHGGSSPEGIANALHVAARAVEERMVERTAEALQAGGTLRSASTASFEGSHD